MKKLIAVLVAVMMVFSCTFALAENSLQSVTSLMPSFTVNTNIQVNEEAVTNLMTAYGVDASTAAMIQGMLPLLSDLSEQFIYADGGLQADVKLKGKEVFSLVAELKENSIALTSDLIPSYVMTLRYETITKLMEQLLSQVQQNTTTVDLDMELIQKAMGKAITYASELTTVFESAITIGEQVKGEYADIIEGVVFNTEVDISVDVNALVNAVKTYVEKLIADETVKAALESIASKIPGVSFDFSDLSIGDVSEEDIPEVYGKAYTITDDNGNQIASDTYVIICTEGKKDDSGNTITYVYVADNSVDVRVDLPALEVSLECHVETLEDGYVVSYAIVTPVVDVELACAVTLSEAGGGVAFALYINDIEQPVVTATIDYALDGERTKTTADGGKAELALDGLMDTENSMTILGALVTDLMNGVSTVLNNIKTVEPVAGSMLELIVNQYLTMYMGVSDEVPAA